MTAYTAPGIKDVDEIIAEVFYVDVDDLRSKRRFRELTEARQFGMWYRCEIMGMSTHLSGNIYDRDHATVLFSKRTVRNLMDTDHFFRIKAETAIKRLKEAGYAKNRNKSEKH